MKRETRGSTKKKVSEVTLNVSLVLSRSLETRRGKEGCNLKVGLPDLQSMKKKSQTRFPEKSQALNKKS